MLFNLSDDHQFIRKGDWVRDLISIYNHRAQAVHCDDITGITARGISFARSFKRNNEVLPVKKTEEEVEYFIYKQKTFDVYSFMKRSTFQKVGPFWEIEKATDPSKIEMWRNGKKSMDAYSDYCERTKKLGLKRVALKFPYLAEFTNDINICRMDFSDKPLVPLFEEGEIEKEFSNLNKPVSSDEIFAIKGIDGFRAPLNRLKRYVYFNFKKWSACYKLR